MEKGVDCTGIIEKSVSDQDYQELRIAAQCILDSVFYPEEGFLYAVCPTAMQERFGVTSHQLGHVVVELDQTAGADVTLFLYQFEDGSWKGSLRAKCDLNVAKIASRFGGGGHVRAAGFSYQGKPEKAVEKVREALKAQRSVQ